MKGAAELSFLPALLALLLPAAPTFSA